MTKIQTNFLTTVTLPVKETHGPLTTVLTFTSTLQLTLHLHFSWHFLGEFPTEQLFVPFSFPFEVETSKE
jgi:hypothetical protein